MKLFLSAATLSLCAVVTVPAFAKKAPRLIAPHSTVYIVPSSLAMQFQQFIEKPPMGAGKLRNADLQIVAARDEAQYAISCASEGEHSHNAAVTHTIGIYLPNGHVIFNVDSVKDDTPLFTWSLGLNRGTQSNIDKLAAHVCADMLAKMIR